MKRIYFILRTYLLVIVGINVLNASAVIAQENNSAANNSTITIRATGVGKNAQKAIDNAEQIALNIILFRGVPNTYQKNPLITTDEATIMSNHQTYFKEFYDNLRYKSFIINSFILSEPAKVKGGKKSVTLDVTFNLNALTKDLEHHNVIRKFGY